MNSRLRADDATRRWATEVALSALAVVVLMQALKHGAFRAPKYFCHLHRMGFASLYTILRKPMRTTW
ncbi:hypothetical protein PSm6_31440 [Pseudomonas solani]|uniref:Uncharacterized protein n=1 Tax=Pseudomonas solani TaxID=2731552 RepID=A0ABM7LAZ7_9PSED|nr:hypothetical protein PSm6_31440 [Pseudomonas solani]